MTPEAQRIAIAEACGLPVVSDGITHYLTPCILGTGKFDPDGKSLTYVPDYLNDLNAIHEAEKLILAENHVGYCRAVLELVCPETKGVIVGLHAGYGISILHATAAQRAEAFLRTLNLWTDS